MPYTLANIIALGSDQVGLDLRAQLVNCAGQNVGNVIAAGFVEHGNGFYGWTYQGFPDGFRGYIRITSAEGEIVAMAAVNPQEAEAAAGAQSAAQAISARLSRIGTFEVGFVSAIAENTELVLNQGDDYPAGAPVEMTLADYVGPDLAGGSVVLTIKTAGDYRAGTGKAVLAKDGTLTVDGSAVTATFTLTAAETAALAGYPPAKRPQYWYEVLATTADELNRTLAKGPLSVLARVADAHA